MIVQAGAGGSGGGGGGTITGGGTLNKIAKFTGATAVGNSAITDDGSKITISYLAGSGTGVVAVDNSGNLSFSAGSAGTFITLTDVLPPVNDSYAGTAGFGWIVNQGATGLIPFNLFNASTVIPVDMVTSSDVTLSGLQNFDGQTGVVGSRVLVWQNSNATQNGVYLQAVGAWSRSTDADTSGELNNLTVIANYTKTGTTYGGSYFNQITVSPTIGVDDIVFQEGGIGAGSGNAGGQVRLNRINAANGTNTINSLNFAQVWNWSTATTQIPFTWTANGLSTGSLFVLSSTSTVGNASKLLQLTRSGANSTASKTNYGSYIEITNTGTTSTNVGEYISASGATNNYALVVNSGFTGLGTTAPTGQLDIKGVGTTTGIGILVKDSANAANFKVLDSGASFLGSGCSNAGGQTAIAIGYQSASSGTASVALGYQVTSSGLVSIGVGGVITSDATLSIGFGTNLTVHGANSLAVGDHVTTSVIATQGWGVGFNLASSNVGSHVLGSGGSGTVTNDVQASLKWASAIDTASTNNQGIFAYYKGNIVLDFTTNILNSNYQTHMDYVANNVLTIANPGIASTTVSVSSVSNVGGIATFNTATSLATWFTGDRVITSTFGVYNNQTYYLTIKTATTFRLYDTRANSIADTGTGAVAFISTDTGTATPQIRVPTQTIANAIQIYAQDTGDNTSSLGLLLEQAVASGTITPDKTLTIAINNAFYKIPLLAL